MADITPNTTAIQDCDNERNLLAKILHRLNLNAGAQVDVPAANVSVTNTPLPIDFDGPQPVYFSADQNVNVTNFPALQTVDGAVDVNNFPADQLIHGPVTVGNFPVSQTVDGTVNVGNFPVTQPVSGTVAVSNLPVTQPVSGTVAVSNFPGTQPVSGTVNIGNTPNVGVTNFPASQNVVVTNTPNVDAGIDFTDDGHAVTVSVPFQFEVSHSRFYREGGVNKAAKLFHVLGKRVGFNSTSVLQDVGEFLGTTTDLFPNLTGVENLELVSSSAQDDPSPAGTGTYSVRITYLTTGHVVATVDYNLNGTAAVAVAEKMLFIYGMEALTGGSGEVSAGNIDLRVAGGGAIHERITAGGNKSLSGRFMVPDNFNCYLSSWSASAIGTTMDVRARATVRTYDRTINDRYLFQDTAYLGAGQSVDSEFEWLKYPARSKFKMSVLPGATAVQNRVDVSMCVMLVQD